MGRVGGMFVSTEGEGALVPAMSKVELYAAIRRSARAGVSKRALQREFGVGVPYGAARGGVDVPAAA
jgi:hypothetical protein